MLWLRYRKRWMEAQALADRLAWENSILVDELHRREGWERIEKVLMDNYGFQLEPPAIREQRRHEAVEEAVRSRKLRPPKDGHL